MAKASQMSMSLSYRCGQDRIAADGLCCTLKRQDDEYFVNMYRNGMDAAARCAVLRPRPAI
jgi:hypothetical protein